MTGTRLDDAAALKTALESSSSEGNSPVFDEKQMAVVFVLGGPGSGKGTQCARIAKDYGFAHFSAGEALREEQERPESKFGDLIRHYIVTGGFVPAEVIIPLLKAKIARAAEAGTKLFLIDGFPRQFDQAVEFEQRICRARFALFLDCSMEVLETRLLSRGETSGRTDDNVESMRKRFASFVDKSMPVVKAYEESGRVIHIDGSGDRETVYKAACNVLEGKGFTKV